MTDDYSINAKITADASGYENGIKKAQKASQNLSKSITGVIQGLGKNGLVGALGAVGLASSGLSATLGTVVKVAKQVSKVVNECTEAYKAQLIAERQLDIAIQNNPFVTGESSNALKQFASEIQKVSNYGDEQLIPLMANLVSLGRTESETMNIIRVATDMSASGAVSLETAINQLNMTLNGNIGRLGMQNAELKDLTDEELKNGKAVEILGKKYKGLAEATADTSKQLANIKGDFKEALGQFTLPSSDMWNKFWAGFYENGISIINKFNDFLDTQIIGKRILENMNSNAQAVAKATGNTVQEVLSDFRYLKEQLSYLSDSEINTLQKTLEQQKNRTEAEERMLTVTKQITQSRKLQAEQDKKDAEAEAKRATALAEQKELENGIAELKDKHLKKIKEQEAKWENIKKVTGEEVTLEEKLKFYQDDLVAIMTEAGGQITTNNQYYKDQMAIINQILSQLGNTTEVKSAWDSKLLDQRIEMLEKEKEMAIENAEEIGEETYDLERYYNERLLELKLEQLAKEKEEELSAIGVSEDDKKKINEYYSNEEKKIYDDLGNYKKKKGKEEEKEEKSKFAVMLEIAKRYAENIKNVFSKIASTIKSVFSGIGNVFRNALNFFKFNPDEALNSLLAIEDAILTFFVETLPKLPSFFSSAIQSIIILIRTLLNAIDWDKVQEIINSVIDIIVENAPQIVNDLVDLVIHIAQTLLNAIIHFVESGGWKTLLDLILDIQKKIENFFIENIDDIVNTIADMIPDLIEFLKNSIVSASKTLGKLAPKILPLIADLINAIIEVITSDEVLESFFDALEGIVEGLIVAIIKLFTKGVPKLLNFAIKLASPQNLMKIVVAIVKGLVKAFAQINWGEVVEDIFTAFIDGIKELFGIHSPSTLFEEFGTYMVEGLVNGLKGIAEAVMIILQPLINAIQTLFSGLFSFISDVIEKILNAITSINQMSFDALEKVIGGLIDSIGKISDSLTAVTKISFDGLNASIGTVTDSLTKITELSFGAISDLANISFETLKTTLSSVSDVLKTISSTAVDLVDVSFKGLKDVIEAIGNSVTNMTNSVTGLVKELKELVKAVNEGMSALNPFSGGGGSSGGGGGESTAGRIAKGILTGGLSELFHWATGTNNAPAGLSVVGEAGPELVKFRGGEQVLNNRNTNKALANMGGTTINQNVTFNNLADTTAFAMLQQLKQYNRQLAINGVV